MQKVEPNSIEAVVLFILYICLQDGKITNKEVKELVVTAPVLQKMYLDIFGEFIHFDLDRIINETFDFLLPKQEALSNQKITAMEQDLFCSLLTDERTQDIALLASRNTAGADGLHKLENSKYQYWAGRWHAS